MKPANLLYRVVLLVCLMVFCQACGEEKDIGKESVYDPTPYPLTLPYYFPDDAKLPTNNPLTEEGVALGRMLFYEKQLSVDNSISCASCHQQEKAFTDGLQFPQGIHSGQINKNTMSLHNLLWVSHLNWDGRSDSLETQAIGPLTNPLEMGLEDVDEAALRLQSTDRYPPKFFEAFGTDSITAENLLKALAQFERTLISDQSKLDRYWRKEYEPTDLELKGIALFETHPDPSQGIRGGNCGDCHLVPFTGGTNDAFNGFHNNGLDQDVELDDGLAAYTGNKFDKGKFRAPSLRNIALTAPYMHDGRFNTLEEVLEHYDEHVQMSKTLDPLVQEASNEPIINEQPIKLHLLPEEKDAILAFLHMLTDSTFIRDERFSNPFAP